MIRETASGSRHHRQQLTYVVEHADIDSAGVVHFSRYAAVMESAVLGYLERVGCGLVELETMGVQPVVRELVIRYLSPAFYGERLAFVVSLDRVGVAHLRTGILVTRAGDASNEPIASGLIDWAIVRRGTKEPSRLPPSLETALRHEETVL